MIRVIIENILLFLLPTLFYVGYVLLMRDSAAKKDLLSGAPLVWLFAAGTLLVIIVLVAFGSTSGGRPGQHYEPPSLKDGHIEPGRIQ
jgi:hypothetical protein